jgi:hypothetical protein
MKLLCYSARAITRSLVDTRFLSKRKSKTTITGAYGGDWGSAVRADCSTEWHSHPCERRDEGSIWAHLRIWWRRGGGAGSERRGTARRRSCRRPSLSPGGGARRRRRRVLLSVSLRRLQLLLMESSRPTVNRDSEENQCTADIFGLPVRPISIPIAWTNSGPCWKDGTKALGFSINLS